MLADYDFYKNNYKGIVITNANSFDYYGERASDELALYSNKSVFTTNGDAMTALKRCACRIADILFSATGNSKNGKTVASESVGGYYSVSYKDITDEQTKAKINTAIKLYIGRYIMGVKKVVW